MDRTQQRIMARIGGPPVAPNTGKTRPRPGVVYTCSGGTVTTQKSTGLDFSTWRPEPAPPVPHVAPAGAPEVPEGDPDYGMGKRR